MVYCEINSFCISVDLFCSRPIALIFVYAIMAAIINSIEKFDASKEDIVVYIKLFNCFCCQMGLHMRQKILVFLFTVGPQTFKLVCLLSNNKPLDMTFE